MCMDEFVKRLYDFMGIYRIFWSQNSHYQYLPIFYRYFFRNSSTCVRDIKVRRFFSEKSVTFSFYQRFIADFFGQNVFVRCVLHSCDFLVEKSAILSIFRRFFDFRLSFAKIFSMPAEN